MITKEVPFIDIHTHVRLDSFSSFAYSYGIHPYVVAKESNLTGLITLLNENKLAAIGETGLDRTYPDTFAEQIELFERHITLAEQYRKPLIIHCVRATADLLQVHKRRQPTQPWIIHGFNGNTTEARQLTARGIFLSVGESIFYPNRKITKSIQSIPLEYLFFETDTSELTIQEIYQKASELLNIPLETLKEQVFANFSRLDLSPWTTGGDTLLGQPGDDEHCVAKGVVDLFVMQVPH